VSGRGGFAPNFGAAGWRGAAVPREAVDLVATDLVGAGAFRGDGEFLPGS